MAEREVADQTKQSEGFQSYNSSMTRCIINFIDHLEHQTLKYNVAKSTTGFSVFKLLYVVTWKRQCPNLLAKHGCTGHDQRKTNLITD